MRNNQAETEYKHKTDGRAWERFGSSVSIFESGDKAVVGAYVDDDNGLFLGSRHILDGTWKEVRKIISSDGTVIEEFGGSCVYLRGSRTIV